MRKLMFLIVILSAASLVKANTIVLEPVTIVHQYQQTSNNPCVIGDPSCDNGTFPETVFPPNAGSYNEVSPVYTVAQIRAITGNSFIIGVDINQSNVIQELSLFTMLINSVVVDTYTANPATLVPPTVGGGNGNGYADYILTGFTSLAGLPGADTVQFHVVMPQIDDGREEYFLISGTSVIPEPTSLLLIGTGLGVIGLAAWRRRK